MVMLVSAVERTGDASGPGARRSYPRRMRLRHHADFDRVYRQGQRHFSAHMTVFYLRQQSGQGARVGYTVSRVLGGAVERNRIKRRLREAVRLTWSGIEVPVDIVINPKKSLLSAGFDDLLKEIVRAFEIIRKGDHQ